MTVNAADVLAAAGAGSADNALATKVLAEANMYVSAYITENLLSAAVQVPATANDAAVLRCATDLFARAKAPFGTQILPDGSGQMIAQRLGADPLGGVLPLLSRWCGPDMGIA